MTVLLAFKPLKGTLEPTDSSNQVSNHYSTPVHVVVQGSIPQIPQADCQCLRSRKESKCGRVRAS